MDLILLCLWQEARKLMSLMKEIAVDFERENESQTVISSITRLDMIMVLDSYSIHMN